MTITIKWLSGFSVAALGLVGLSNVASAQAAAPPTASATSSSPAATAPPAPAAVTAKAPGVQTAEAGPPNVPAAEEEAPTEMKFGRGGPRAQSAPPAEVPPDAAPRSIRPRTMEEVAGAAIQEMTIRSARWRYSLNFFGDLSLSAHKPVGDTGQFGFGLGAQDVLIRGELSNNIVATTEMAFEPGDEGVGIDIERFNVRWQTSRYFIEAGRTHTGFGYWNNAYHHGRWLQPTILRPRWVAFEDEGGILPVHWVGAGTGTRVPIGTATLNLMATVGNGRGKIVDDVRNEHDYQAMKAFHASAELVGIGRPELRVGVAGIIGKIPGQPMVVRPDFPDTALTEVIGSAHIAYVNVPLLVIAEGYDVAHLAMGHQWTTYGGFLLAGYAIGRVTPYVEVERIANKGGVDPFFTPDHTAADAQPFDTLGGILGVRIDLSDWTALKAEYRQTKVWDLDRVTRYTGVLNWSWGF